MSRSALFPMMLLLNFLSPTLASVLESNIAERRSEMDVSSGANHKQQTQQTVRNRDLFAPVSAPVTPPSTEPDWQQRLYRRVASSSEMTMKRPNLNDVPINVTVRIMLLKLHDLVEKAEVMEATIRLQVGWTDRRLAWNPADYNNITEILLQSSAVWTPDLAIINSVSDVYGILHDFRFDVKIEYDGKVWWHPTGVSRTYCRMRLQYFPFDRQRCSWVIESPTVDSRYLMLSLRRDRPPIDIRMYVESEAWHLLTTYAATQKIKGGVTTYFSRIEFWCIVQRSRLFHTVNFILPCFILSGIQALFFFLPATHPQRVGSTTVTMLSVMVSQSMIVNQLPQTSESVPLLSIYIDLVILISATSVSASILTARCRFKSDSQAPVPAAFKQFQHSAQIRRDSARLNDHRRSSIPGYAFAEQSMPNASARLLNKGNARSGHAGHLETEMSVIREDEMHQPDASSPHSPHAPLHQTPSINSRHSTNININSSTWLDILDWVNAIMGWPVAVAISVGPIIIFIVVPLVFDPSEDYATPGSDNMVMIVG